MIKINSSYKYPIFFFALIALISFCEISNSQVDPRAGACAAPITSNNIAFQFCSTQPTTQIITIYKVAFCTALPTVPTATTATGMTNCSTVFENTAGARVSIVKSTGTTPSGTFTDPPYGNYTFAYVELSHVITYKSNFVFANNAISSADSPAGAGPNCHTDGATNVFYWGTLRGITCTGNVVGVADNTNVTVNSFDDGDGVYSSINDQGATIGTHVYLIKSNGALASNSAQNAVASGANAANAVAKLVALIPMTANVTPDTISYNLQYNNTLGVDILQLQNGANFNIGVSAAYWDMTFQVQ